MTKTVEDSALLFNLTNGLDGKDSTLVNLQKHDFSQVSKGVKGKTIGIPKEFEMDGIDPQIVKAWAEARKKLELEGAKIVEVSLPHAMDSIKVYYFISTAEASSNLARYDGIKYGHRTQKI